MSSTANQKRITVIAPDGAETELGEPPTFTEMRGIVGGWIEQVRVLRQDLPGFTYTVMFANEEGLIIGLPRNERATQLYQANVRRQYEGHPDPFAAQDAELAKMYEKMGAAYIKVPHPDLNPSDPHIAGTVVFFDGYTEAEVNKIYGRDEMA